MNACDHGWTSASDCPQCSAVAQEAVNHFAAKACQWKQDGDANHYVPCNDWRVHWPEQLDVDFGHNHAFAFCPYCGGQLEVVKR